ncbi:MAG: hypothetical protein WBO82_01820 [Neisseria sp.]
MIKKITSLTAVCLLAACSTAKTEPQPTAQAEQPLPSFVFVKDVAGAKTVGKGSIGYRFVLLQPNTNRPAVNTPFAISHAAGKLPFANVKNTYHGITDERGMTPLFAFEQAVPEQGWVLVPRVGEGMEGGWVTLSNPQQQLLVGIPYSIAVCGAKPYWVHGKTNSIGQTAHVAYSGQAQSMLYPYSADPAVQQTRLQACPAPKAAAKSKPNKKSTKK